MALGYHATRAIVSCLKGRFLLLLPRAILSDPVGSDYEQYIHDAHRHYQIWLDITSTFNWPSDSQWIDNTASSTHSYDSRPEADIHLDDVFEKPVRTGNGHITSVESGNANRFYTEDLNEKPERTDRINGENRGRESSTHLDIECDKRDGLPVKTGDTIYDTNGENCRIECCTDDDVKLNKIGKCNKPASDCPFSQKLVMRSRDLTSAPEEEEFDEGPFLKMLFKLLSNMPSQPYQVNLHLTSIVSKLALMPHPNLHEYLLNPVLPTAARTRTLFKTLQELARRLTMEIPRLRNYKKLIENTRLQLMSEDLSYDESAEHNQLVESLIVVEEFCKELAAIAFVKYQHNIQCR